MVPGAAATKATKAKVARIVDLINCIVEGVREYLCDCSDGRMGWWRISASGCVFYMLSRALESKAKMDWLTAVVRSSVWMSRREWQGCRV